MPVEIALTPDVNYYIGTVIAVCSIASSARPDCSLRFHILNVGFEDCHRTELVELARRFHSQTEVVFHDVSGIDLSDFPLYSNNRMTYIRLQLPRILKDIAYVIYSDVDVLWMSDVARLWELRSQVPLVGCVREQSAKTIEQEREWFCAHGLEFDASRYICAGISLYNLEAIRRHDAFKEVVEFGCRHNDVRCADQTMMYAVLRKRMTLLPDEWQTFPRNGISAEPGEPLVLHYAGEAPWKATRLTHMITDTQLLWFRMCAKVFGESVWKSLRRFYSVPKIVTSRLLFLGIYRIPWVKRVFFVVMRKLGCGPYDEALPRSWR